MNNVKQYLRLKGILVKELAEALGLSTTRMSQITGGGTTTEQTRMKVAEFLGVPVWKLFPEEHKEPSPFIEQGEDEWRMKVSELSGGAYYFTATLECGGVTKYLEGCAHEVVKA